MHCLAIYFQNLHVHLARCWEHTGRVLRPVSLCRWRLRSEPAETGREKHFRLSAATLVMIAPDV